MAASQAIAAWMTDWGGNVMIANWTTSQFQYSYCNSYDTPVYPVDTPNVLELERGPGDNTPIVGAGWYHEDVNNTYASVFYQDNNGAISNAYLQCNMSTGLWMLEGNWPISVVAPSISHQTGLALLYLGPNDGYRLFYHDADMTVQVLFYNPNATLWSYHGTVSDDVQLTNSLAAEVFFENNVTLNYTVVSVKDESNIEASRYSADDLWHITTFPEPLTDNLTWTNTSLGAINATAGPLSLNATSSNGTNMALTAFDGSQVSLGMTVDLVGTRSVFYLGSDQQLHQYTSPDNSSHWTAQPAQPAGIWPQADEASGPLAVAWDPDYYWGTRLYYWSGGALTELRWGNGSAANTTFAWATARALPTYMPEMLNGTASSGGSSLSVGAQAGIGVGVAVGVLGLIAAGVVLFLGRRRRRNKAAAAATAAAADGGAAEKADVSSSASVGNFAAPGKPSEDLDPSSVGSSPESSPRAEQAATLAAASTGQSQQAPPPSAAEESVQPQKQEVPTVERPQELEGTHAHEMADQNHTHELGGK